MNLNMLGLIVIFVFIQIGLVTASGPVEPDLTTVASEEDMYALRGMTRPKSTKSTIFPKQTSPLHISFSHTCDYIVWYCLRAFQTARLCARNIFNTYRTFKNYCMMDFVNCNALTHNWQIVHMGDCFKIIPLKHEYQYMYWKDTFLRNYYVYNADYNPDDYNDD
ncbi:uncharacterized protein LOC142983574 [Anticarsia gemmatalis]|uniref:uncharacterized protein LOC142983574 n=1 Tax=Anticarsia gemmatalis TaxID=129554 RepID=UPI003F7694AA